MKYIPCPLCERLFESDESRDRHIRSIRSQGHGNKICSNCGEPLSKCEDIGAVGQSYACKSLKVKHGN